MDFGRTRRTRDHTTNHTINHNIDYATDHTTDHISDLDTDLTNDHTSISLSACHHKDLGEPASGVSLPARASIAL